MDYTSEILIVGGSFGGVSAALSACRTGQKVILTEECLWIGGQATSQGVPLDEHPWMEQYGSTASYREFRSRIRDYYRRNYPLTANAMRDRHLNPGAPWVSALGFEPRAGLSVLEEMLAPYRTAGLLTVLTETKPVSVETDGNRIRAVSFVSLRSGDRFTVSADFFIDATELGDLLSLGNIEHVVGRESQAETGEPCAPDTADPLDQQPITHLIALDYLPGEEHVIEKPASYEEFRSSFEKIRSVGVPSERGRYMPDFLFAVPDERQYVKSIWNFRRYFYQGNFEAGCFPSDITALMNGNEYADGVLCGVPEAEAEYHKKRAREMSKSLVYYLQTELPHENGCGFPGLRVRTDVYGTEDGLAQYPYIRESRRIRALYTVTQNDFLVSEHPDGPVRYEDSVGLAGYKIDIHSANRAGSFPHWRQQIPLGALIPQRVENLLAGGKNLGVTHIMNGSFRLHPTEWNVGEAAGALASFCIRRKTEPAHVRNTKILLDDFLHELAARGVETEWPHEEPGYSYYSYKHNDPEAYFGESDKLFSESFLLIGDKKESFGKPKGKGAFSNVPFEKAEVTK